MMHHRLTTLAAGAALCMLVSPAVAAQQTGRALSLADALRIAETASEGVGIARAGTDRAQGELLRARSEFYPQVFGTILYTRTLASEFEDVAADMPPADSGSFDFGSLPFGQPNNWTLGLEVQQTLFSGGRVSAQARMAEASRRIADASLASARAQLVLDVIESYYDATLAERLLTIAASTLDQAETTLRHTQLARQVGNQPEFELLRATVARDNQRPVLIQRKTDRDISLMRLKQMLNLPLDEPLTLTTPLDDTAAVVPMRLTSGGSSVPDSVLPSERAPVRQAADAVAASENAVRLARSQRWPQVNINMLFGRVAYPSGGVPDWGQFRTNLNVGAVLRVPLVTGGRISGDVRVARADLEEARYRLTQARELSELDSHATLARLAAAEASFAASAGTAQQASRAYQIAEIRYREGISTQVELSDSRILLEQATANRALAARDLAVARARIALLRDLPFGAIGAPSPGVPPTPQSQTQQQPARSRVPQSAAFTGNQTGAFAP
jgi:outer membrane protein